MSEILLFWVALVIGFIIIELLTSTFYGLSLSLASGLVALYIYISHDTDFQILHALIFVIASAIFAYFLPKFLISSKPDVPQGMERYIGEKRTIKKTWWDFKISLDGVGYLIDSDDEVSSWDRVEIIGHKWASMRVKKI